MSEQEELLVQDELLPQKPQKRRPAFFICLVCVFLLLGIGLFLLLGNTDPKERAVIDFCNDIKNGDFTSAYEKHLSKTLKDTVTLEEFTKRFSGFQFFHDMGKRKMDKSNDLFQMRIDGMIDGSTIRTLIAAGDFDTDNMFGKIMIIELSQVVYAKELEGYISTDGEYVLSVSFYSNVEPSFNTEYCEIFIARNGDTIAQPSIISTMTQDSASLYTVYFSVPQDAIGPELTFSYWGEEISLKDIMKEKSK